MAFSRNESEMSKILILTGWYPAESGWTEASIDNLKQTPGTNSYLAIAWDEYKVQQDYSGSEIPTLILTPALYRMAQCNQQYNITEHILSSPHYAISNQLKHNISLINLCMKDVLIMESIKQYFGFKP